MDFNELISNLKEGPKGFSLQLSIYCHDQNLYRILPRLRSHRLTPCHFLSHLITPYPLGWKENHLHLTTLKLVSRPQFFLSHLITPSHSLSQLITPYPLG